MTQEKEITLKDYLAKQERAYVEQVSHFFDIPFEKGRTPVPKMAEMIDKALSDNPVAFLRHFSEYELRMLRDLSMKGMNGSLLLPYIHHYDISLSLHFIEEVRDLNGFHVVRFPQGMYQRIAPYAPDAYAKGVLERTFKYDFFMWGCTVLYGFLPDEDFSALVDGHFKKNNKFITNCSLRYKAFCVDTSSSPNRICAPDAEMVREEVFALMKKTGYDRLPLAEYTLEEIMECGMEAPLFTPLKNTPEGRNLFMTIVDLGFPPTEVDVVMFDIWMVIQTGDMSQIDELISQYIDEDEDDAEERMWKMKKAILRYRDVVPMWAFRGRTWKEVKGEHDYGNEPVSSFSPSSPGEGEKLVGLRRLSGVGRNDPCPCGSGLKYKNCHGKNLN